MLSTHTNSGFSFRPHLFFSPQVEYTHKDFLNLRRFFFNLLETPHMKVKETKTTQLSFILLKMVSLFV